LVVSRLYELLYVTESTFEVCVCDWYVGILECAGPVVGAAVAVDAVGTVGVSFVYIVMILVERFLGNNEHF
jgi:hypothetical protein